VNSSVCPIVYSQSVNILRTDSLLSMIVSISSNMALLPVNEHKTKGWMKNVESLKWRRLGYSLSRIKYSRSFTI